MLTLSQLFMQENSITAEYDRNSCPKITQFFATSTCFGDGHQGTHIWRRIHWKWFPKVISLPAWTLFTVIWWMQIFYLSKGWLRCDKVIHSGGNGTTNWSLWFVLHIFATMHLLCLKSTCFLLLHMSSSFTQDHDLPMWRSWKPEGYWLSFWVFRGTSKQMLEDSTMRCIGQEEEKNISYREFMPSVWQVRDLYSLKC